MTTYSGLPERSARLIRQNLFKEATDLIDIMDLSLIANAEPDQVQNRIDMLFNKLLANLDRFKRYPFFEETLRDAIIRAASKKYDIINLSCFDRINKRTKELVRQADTSNRVKLLHAKKRPPASRSMSARVHRK
jgi:hypothetical protein